MATIREVSIAELNGFLHGFAWVNTKTNHGYTFRIDILEKQNSLQSTLAVYFEGTASAISTEPLEDWKAELREVLPRWLLAYLRDPVSIGKLVDRTNTFSLSHKSDWAHLADYVCAKISDIIKVQRASRVRITETGFYECAWADYALESQREVMVIHFGVSD